MRPLAAIVLLTIRAALRYRVVVVLSLLLLGAVVVLPLIIKDDGSAQGFTQIILTYTLSLATALLGFATLWLSCGTLAREVEEAQMQMVAVKPIPRWKIWLGKWIGVLLLNGFLLALTGVFVYSLMTYRATKLPPAQRAVLEKEIFVARAVATEEKTDFDEAANEIIREQIAKGAALPEGLSIEAMRNMLREQLKSREQLVPPNYRKQWEIPVGDPEIVRNRPMSIRAKVDPPVPGIETTFETHWEFGDINTRYQYETNLVMIGEAYVEFPIPSNVVNDKGILYIRVDNFSRNPMHFPVEDGLEVLYRSGSFAANFARGLLVIFCWLALLAALGLASGSFLSFPVAAFCTLGILFASFSTGTLRQIVEDQGILAVDPNTAQAAGGAINSLAVPLAKGMLWLFNLARGFSPIDNLSTGRVIGWDELGRAVFQIGILLCGFLAAAGIIIFNRRELASAQK